MIVKKYLFNEYNVPPAQAHKISAMNRELIEKLSLIANRMYEDNVAIEIFDDVSQMVAEEIYVKYC